MAMCAPDKIRYASSYLRLDTPFFLAIALFCFILNFWRSLKRMGKVPLEIGEPHIVLFGSPKNQAENRHLKIPR